MNLEVLHIHHLNLDMFCLVCYITFNWNAYKGGLHQNSIVVEIKRLGKAEPTKVTELDEGNVFKGDENDLLLYTLHKHNFCCLFELSKFPFDVQKCSIDINVPNEIRNYVALHPKMLNYSGNTYITVSTGKSVCPSVRNFVES